MFSTLRTPVVHRLRFDANASRSVDRRHHGGWKRMIAEGPPRMAANGEPSRHNQQDGRTKVVHVVQLAFQGGKTKSVLLGESQQIGIRPLPVTAHGTE